MTEINGIKLVKYDEDTFEPLRNEDGFLIECKVGEPGICVMRVTEVFAFSGYHGDKKQSDAKKIHSAFDEDDCWINSGDVLVMNENYEVFFCDRLGDTFRPESNLRFLEKLCQFFGKKIIE